MRCAFSPLGLPGTATTSFYLSVRQKLLRSFKLEINTLGAARRNGQFDTTKMAYAPGSPGCIVVVSLYYQWPIYVSLFGNNLANQSGSNRLLVATSVFRK